jgi:hypothetical protein
MAESARSGDSVSRLRHGPSSVSLTSSDSSQEGRPYRRRQSDLSPLWVEARAGAVFSCATPGPQRGPRSGPGRLAQVIVFGDTAPRSHLVRAWTSMHPQGVYIRQPGRAAAEGEGETACRRKKPYTAVGRERSPGAGPFTCTRRHSRRYRSGGREEVPSDGTRGNALLTSALKRLRVATSTLGGHRVLGGREADEEQPGARSPPQLGGRTLFINGYF